jgi:integrase
MAQATRRRGRRFDGEGTVYQEGETWRAALRLGDGRRIRRRAGSEAEAYGQLEQMRAAHGLGLSVPSADQLGGYLEWWLEMQSAKVGTDDRDMSVNTLLNYRWALGPVIEAHGGRRLRDLEPEHVEMVLARMAREGKSRRSIVRVRTVLGQALDTAQRRGKVHRNVARLAEMPRTAPPAERRSLTVDQAAALLEAAKGYPVEAFIVIGLMLGLRPGELLGLRWQDIDLDAGTLEVTGSLKREPAARSGERETLRRGDVKRGIRAARRRLDLPAPVVEALRAQRTRQRQERLLAGPEWHDHDLVFATAVGTPISPSGMNRRLAQVTERAGLGRWSMTELGRHSAASLMYAAGVPKETIADIYGHSTTRMLDMHYRHELRPSLGAHVAVMEGLFGTGGPR